jgi:hypothetical protein
MSAGSRRPPTSFVGNEVKVPAEIEAFAAAADRRAQSVVYLTENGRALAALRWRMPCALSLWRRFAGCTPGRSRSSC